VTHIWAPPPTVLGTDALRAPQQQDGLSRPTFAIRPISAVAVILQQCLRFLLKNLQQFGVGVLVICSNGMLVFGAFDEEAELGTKHLQRTIRHIASVHKHIPAFFPELYWASS